MGQTHAPMGADDNLSWWQRSKRSLSSGMTRLRSDQPREDPQITPLSTRTLVVVIMVIVVVGVGSPFGCTAGDAHFPGATFSVALFEGATFNGRANFETATFRDFGASFDRVTFNAG